MRIHTGLGTVLLATLLAVSPPSASAAPGSDQGRDAEQHGIRAEAALARAQALFRRGGDTGAAAHDDRPARRTTPAPDPRQATLVLRDLAVGLDHLEPTDQEAARRILARPTDGEPDAWTPAKYGDAPHTDTCTARLLPEQQVCVHWVTDPASVHAPDLDDAERNGVPDWVEENQQVIEEVWRRTVGDLGYRPPRPDDGARNHGPDARTDIYLAELRRDGIYGYCTMDDVADQAAYCVLDNDFLDYAAPAEESLRVTAAHEFFHAVQFGYNPFADHWLMEGTAAWVEDEVYDDIDDNLQYLDHSALSCPGEPLDQIGPGSSCYPNGPSNNWAYGSWIWWRFLTEHFAVDGQARPFVVRQVWERLALDGRAEGSLQALHHVLQARGTTFRQVFAGFAAANRIPARRYDEGESYASYVAHVAPSGRFRLTRSRRSIDWRATELDHLSSRHALVRPGRDLVGRWRLRVVLDLPPRPRGSMARAIVHRRDGHASIRRVALDGRGDARLVLPFTRREISHVTLSLVNASTRLEGCGGRTTWTCGGTPVDDDLVFAFRARAIR